jgi:hypothetical protein
MFPLAAVAKMHQPKSPAGCGLRLRILVNLFDPVDEGLEKSETASCDTVSRISARYRDEFVLILECLSRETRIPTYSNPPS